jgi:protein-S-isoprenylcysteine O-methyltransferase Ste14
LHGVVFAISLIKRCAVVKTQTRLTLAAMLDRTDRIPDLTRKRLLVRTFIFLGLLGSLFFVTGGAAWPAARVYVALLAVMGIGTGLMLLRRDPALLAERMQPPIQKEQKGWDKVLIGVLLLLYVGWLVLIELDAERFHWSSVPLAVQVIGAILICVTICSQWLIVRENSFVAPVVKIQRERGHSVVTTGPYAFVRHPMYAGAMLFLIGTPLLLGSWWGLLLTPLLIGVLANPRCARGTDAQG